MAEEVLSSVEAKRLELETNIAKLEADLRHWKTWDAEYEGLKEELRELGDGTTEKDILRIATEFDGELLTKKEIDQITGIDKATIREPKYVIRLIEQRQGYVTQNISTISRQIDSTKATLEDLDNAAPHELASEPALPISEIIEELDDDDNVITSKVQNPEHVTAQLVETLRQTGVTDIGSKATVIDQSTEPQSTSEADRSLISGSDHLRTSNAQSTAPKLSGASNGSERYSQLSGDQVANKGSRPLTKDLLSGSFRPGDRVIEIDDDDEVLASGAILPKDESPEDARLRREMLEYHLNEVGNVVAEIDLLEGDSDDDDFIDELADIDDHSVTSDLSEEEDEHGRSLRPTVTDGMRKQMAELEKRLKGQFMTNMGPEYDPDQLSEDQPTSTKQPPPARDEVPVAAAKGGAKSVRFAEELNVSPAPKPVQQHYNQPAQDQPTLADTLVERSAGQKITEEASSSGAKKVSRFKASRTPTEPTQPSQPTQILSNNVLERASAGPPTEPAEDEFDPELQRRQLAARYYELRNDSIRKQGGFKAPEDEEDDGEGPLMEEMPDGRMKKVSRFKAARMKH